jgi:hypothetical protein
MATKGIDGKSVAATVRQAFNRPGGLLTKAAIGQGLAVVTTISGQHADWSLMLRFGWYRHIKFASDTVEEIVDRIISAGCVCLSSARSSRSQLQLNDRSISESGHV